MALRDWSARKLLAPVIVMALRAGEIELSLALNEHLATGLQEGPRAFVVCDIDGQTARLISDISGEREQFLALEGKRRCLLLLRTADVDALLKINRSSACRIEGGIARRHAFHARARVAVAIRA